MKIEWLTDDKCKCCLGHPSKRRRIVNMAKNFFSTLGHKSKKETAFEIQSEEFPPSYDSLEIQQQAQLQQPPQLEGTEILEMDAGPVQPLQLDSVNYEPQPTNLCEPILACMEEPINVFDSLSIPCLNTQQTSSPAGSKPLLALDTHNIEQRAKVPRTKYLSPSSSLRSTTSSQGISPISSGSGLWTLASNIDTTLASPITPFSPSDAESTALSRENSCKFPKDYPINLSNGPNWIDVSDKTNTIPGPIAADKDHNYMLESVSELPGDDPLSLAIPRVWGSDPFLFSFDPKENYSWSSSIDTEFNVLFTSDNIGSPDVAGQNQQPQSSGDPKTLVSSTWDALHEHVSSSFEKISDMDSSIAQRLRSLSHKDVASKGLSSLRSILNGVEPNDPVDYLCFVHLVFAFSLVIHEDDLRSRCCRLFKQAMAYRGFLNQTTWSPYFEIVTAIWQPTQQHEADKMSGTNLSRSSSLKGKETEFRNGPSIPNGTDALIVVAQNFLDDLEMSVVGSNMDRPLEILTSDLWSTHLSELCLPTSNDAFAITVDYIIRVLCQNFHGSQNLSPKLKTINQRVATGSIPTIRKLELELLLAGKNSMPSSELFDEFIPQVRGLCDPIYEQQGFNPRTKYHVLGVALVESLFDLGQKQDNLSHFPVPDLDDFLENLEESLVGGENGFGLDMDTSLDIPTASTDETTAQAVPISVDLAVPSRASITPNSTVNPNAIIRISSSTHVSTTPRSQSEKESTIPPTEVSWTANGNESPAEAAASTTQKVEANSSCEICGYRPRGDPQWFKGSMAKHKKLQHSTEPPRIYRCPFTGCNSAYKNRPDNLRQHQIEKGHFINGVDEKGRRPQKRKKMDP